MSAHWAAALIGREWINGEHDCWAFFRQVQKEQFDITVPAIDVDAADRLTVCRTFRDHDERSQWVEVAPPREGDAVLMAHSRYPSHVGIWCDIDGGGVLHCITGAGVVFSRPQQLRAAGWTRLTYYRHLPA